MGIRPPCCDKQSVKKGLWSAEEDAKLLAYVSTHGTGNWTNVPKKAGLKRCGKSCRLRWTNYLRPNLKHEGFTLQEEELIVTLHATMGSRWSIIADQLPGRTDNDVKNYWNTKLSKKLALSGIDPVTHRPISEIKHIITALHFSAAVQSPLLFQPPIPSAAPQPQKEPEWADFLAEDAFSSLEEQAAYRDPAPSEADAAPLGGPQLEQPGGSFVEELLHRDWEIMSALVAGHCPL